MKTSMVCALLLGLVACGGAGSGNGDVVADQPSGDTANDSNPADNGSPDNGVPDTGDPGAGEEGVMVGMTAAHNAVRDTVGIPNLVWDTDVAAFAAEWADELVNRGCAFEHRPRSGEFAQQYGENLAGFGGQSGTPEQVVGLWAEEEADYDYESNTCSAVCGHYTQIVWRDSVRLGCAMRECEGQSIWVCNYDPPGNFVGRKPY